MPPWCAPPARPSQLASRRLPVDEPVSRGESVSPDKPLSADEPFPARGLLDGVTVVAVEQAVSAPFCTRTLADLGARVIKIEPPGRGDFTRAYDDVVNGMAAHFVWLGRGKESVTLDLKHPAGLEVLHRLLARADVLVSKRLTAEDSKVTSRILSSGRDRIRLLSVVTVADQAS